MERDARVARPRLAPQFPGLVFAEVRYRVKSWRRLDLCRGCEGRRARARRADGPVLSRLLDGRRGRDLGSRRAAVERRARARALDPRPARRSRRSRGKRLDVLHGSLDRWLPGIPGVSPASSRRGFERARAFGVAGRYTLIPGACTGSRCARPGDGSCRFLARRPGTRLVAAQLDGGLNCRRRSHLCLVGRLTFQTSRSFSRPRMIHQETSIWKRWSPWRAEAGNAWWLLCQPSPKTSSATSQLLRDSSRSGSRGGRTCGRSSSR